MTARRTKFVRSDRATVCACLVSRILGTGEPLIREQVFVFSFAWQAFRMKFLSISKRRHIRGASSTLEEVGGMFL